MSAKKSNWIILLPLALAVGGGVAVWRAGQGEPLGHVELPAEVARHRALLDQVNRAKMLARDGEHAEVLRLTAPVLDAADVPDLVIEAELLTAAAHAHLGRYDEAQQRFARLAAEPRDSPDVRPLVGSAEAYSVAGDHDRAAQQLTRIVADFGETRPDQCGEALFTLASVHLRAGRDRLALAALERVVTEFPGLEGFDARVAERRIEVFEAQVAGRQDAEVAELIDKARATRVAADNASAGAAGKPLDEVGHAWSRDKGPYVLTGPVRVPAGVTLTIGAGTVIRFGVRGQLVVDGRLEAVGTEAEPIVFRPLVDGAAAWWAGLRITPDEAGEPSRIEHVRIIAARAGIACETGTVRVRNAIIEDSVNFGLHVTEDGVIDAADLIVRGTAQHGVGCEQGGSMRLTKTTITGSGGFGISCALTREAVAIVDCLIEGNRAGGVLFRDRTTATMKDSRVRDNRAAGVLCRGRATPTLVGNTISGNDGDGVRALQGCTVTLTDNTITDNKGDGLHYEVNITGTVQNNTIARNAGSGVRCRLSSPDLVGNRITDNGAAGVWLLEKGLTVLKGNVLTGNKEAALRNHSADTVEAGGNFWGTTDPAQIGAQIQDHADQDEWGVVRVQPALETAPDPSP